MFLWTVSVHLVQKLEREKQKDVLRETVDYSKIYSIRPNTKFVIILIKKISAIGSSTPNSKYGILNNSCEKCEVQLNGPTWNREPLQPIIYQR